MNQNHDHEYEDMIRLEQAIRDKQLTGNRVIDRLSATVPRPDPSRRDALEAYLVAQLSPESERKESVLMDMPVEMKRKNQPRRRRGWGIAAIVTIVLAIGGAFVLPNRLQTTQFGSGRSVFIQPERTRDLASAMLTATAIVAEMTRDAENASEGLVGQPEMTATAIIRQATLMQIAPTLTAIESANIDNLRITQVLATETARFSRVSDDEKTATALIQEVTDVFFDQTLTAQIIFAAPGSNDALTATALLYEVTQVFADQTATAAAATSMRFASPELLATPTPEPNLSAVRQTIWIPMTRLVPYDNRTVSPLFFTDNKRLVLLTELQLTQYEPILGEAESGNTPSTERPIIAASARIVDVNQENIGAIPMIEVQVDPSEYELLKWFVESTNVQLLFIASR